MYLAAVFLPLLGFLIVGIFGNWIGDRASQLITCIGVGIAALISINLFMHIPGSETLIIPVLDWVNSGSLSFNWALRFDALSMVMLLVVNGVSFLVHVYSVGYMSHDKSIPRFMAYLSLFTFFMLMLVTSDNLAQMFFGWEGVGLASYLLIGFWYEKPEANAAAIKAFVVNRVGDFGFALGIFGIFMLFDSITFSEIFDAAPKMAQTHIDFLGYDVHAMTVLCILLFIGAMGKSAQLLLHTWLPDAMEGPTPVSALIHAATMVTAGVFLVCRMSPLFEFAPMALQMVTIVGASTAFFAATIGLVQNDIKRVIAYSTCSQLGYMFFACGVGAYSAGMFHLTTHAFFKALLFLSAGSVIHAMSGEQDMRKYGGLWRVIPITYVMIWIGNLALAGIPPFAGYFSKDMVLEAAYAAHSGVGMYAFWLGLAAAFCTAFYSWRLLLMTFHGKPRADAETMSHAHESPWVMLVPLLILAGGAIAAGWTLKDAFIGEHHDVFWGAAIFMGPGNEILEHAHHVPTWVKMSPLFAGLAGILLAYWFYMIQPAIPARLAKTFPGVYNFLLNKWYFDELYDKIFVQPALRIGRSLWLGGDGAIIDGLGPNGIASVSQRFAGTLSRFQSGFMYHYAFVMLCGVAGFISYFILRYWWS
ncbi:MAG: NADH-quinone oxidoreductase subunit L [Alphaproteobacteria bacterium]|nr:MAG: NADH-quinone oxidoreductase subunit L [Alphaproteobacteria bacterium]